MFYESTLKNFLTALLWLLICAVGFSSAHISVAQEAPTAALVSENSEGKSSWESTSPVMDRRDEYYVALNQLAQAPGALSRSVTLRLRGATLDEALRRISEETGLEFVYGKQVAADRRVSVDLESVPAKEALQEILRGTGRELMLSRNGQLILVNQAVVTGPKKLKARSADFRIKPMEIQAVEEASFGSKRQQGQITGTVTDSLTGEPIPGANVVIVGTQQGAASNAEGSYTISGVEPGTYDVEASFVGYAPKMVEGVEVQEGEATTVDFQLVESAVALDEIVAIGYGEQRRQNVTGAVGSVEGEELANVPTTNITNALSGQIPGLITVDGSGSPGSGADISIRGSSTFGDNSVLVVVDGVVRENFDHIDPNSIESISVLKDAASAAIYGSRAANGVLLINTKRGRSGKPTFNYNSYVGFQQPTEYPRLLNGYEFARTRNEAVTNEGQPPYYTEEEMEAIRQGDVTETDWYNETLKDRSLQMRHNLNVRGGSDAIRYFMSAGYANEDGMYDRINFHSYSIRSNVDADITSNLVVSADLELSSSKDNGSGYNEAQIFNDIIGAYPLDPAYNPDGTIAYTQEMHPIEQVVTGYSHDDISDVRATLNIKQDIPFMEGLSVEGRLAAGKETVTGEIYNVPIRMDRQVGESKIVTEEDFGETIEIYSTGGYNGKTALRKNSSAYTTTYFVSRINYNNNFGDHALDAVALFEQFEANSDDFWAFRTNFPADGLDELSFGGEDEKDANGSSFEDARRSFVARVNYDYRSRYLFQASFRADASVAFPPSNRWGYFPAFSAGWRLSEEPFMRDSEKLGFIDDLKIRTSFGVFGNDRNVYAGKAPTFQFRQVYLSEGPLVIGGNGVSAITPGVLPNPGISWETAYNYDFGVDGSLWDRKLEFETGVFYKRTSNILLSRIRSVPATFGAELPAENYAVVDNMGFELSLTHNNSIGDLNYYVSANGSFAGNEVVTLDEPANIPERLKQTGRPLGFIVGYDAIGFFQSEEEIENYLPQFSGGQQPGDVKYADVNGDGRVDVNDQTIISVNNSTPKVVGGLSFGGGYKGFDLSVRFQGAAKVSRLLYGEARTFFQGGSRNMYAQLLDYWTPENRDATYPRPTVGFNPNNSVDSDLYLRDTKYIRLKSLNFGYSLPESLLDSFYVDNLRIYLSGTNLFHLDSKLNMFDPEMPSGSGAYYPQQRSINLGVNMTF